jgi:hypothetical protein
MGRNSTSRVPPNNSFDPTAGVGLIQVLDSSMRNLWKLYLTLILLVIPATLLATQAREIGEYFSISSLHYVGIKNTIEGTVAVLRSDCGSEFSVGVGGHIGKNDGVIKLITKDEIAFTEIVPDGNGGWVEKERRMAVQPRAADDESNHSFKPTAGVGPIQ